MCSQFCTIYSVYRRICERKRLTSGCRRYRDLYRQKRKVHFFGSNNIWENFFLAGNKTFLLSLALFRQRSPRYRMTTDGAKKCRRLLIYDIFSYNPLVLPRLSRVLLVFDCSQCKSGNLWAKTAYEKSSYRTNIFRICIKIRENKSNQAHLYAFFAWAYNYVVKVIIRRFE